MPTLEDILGFVVNPPPGDGSLTASRDELPHGVVRSSRANQLAYILPPASGGDDTATIQAAITAMQGVGSILLDNTNGPYHYTTLTIRQSLGIGALAGGTGENYRGRVNGSVNNNGPALICTALSGDGVLVQPPDTTTRIQFVTWGVDFIGNGDQAGATGGGGVHLYAPGTSQAIIFQAFGCNFVRAYGDNLILDGNVFESGCHSCQANQSATGRGVVLQGNGGGIPQLTVHRFSASNNYQQGISAAGGGMFGFNDLACVGNGQTSGAEGLAVNGVRLVGANLDLEINGTGATPQATIQACTRPIIDGIDFNFNGKPNSTGIAISNNSFFGRLSGLWSGSLGAGNQYFAFTDTSCHSWSFPNFDGTNPTRFNTNSIAGIEVSAGSRRFTARQRSCTTITTGTANLQPDTRYFDTVQYNVNAAGATLGIFGPVMTLSNSYQQGQRLTIDVINTSGGAITVNWLTGAGAFTFAGGTVPTAPATGKRRRIEFEYDSTANTWYECWRSTADL